MGFSVFANGGYRVEPYLITRVEDAEGNVLEQANPTIVCPQCPETATLYTDEMDKKDEETKTTALADTPPATESSDSETHVAVPVDSGDTREAVSVEPEIVQPRVAPRVISAENAFIMNTIMRDVVKFGTGRRALALRRNDLAGKTGTTNEFRDAWFSGFNGDVVTTTWVGFDQPSSLGRHEAGAKAALPIWVDYMRVALKGRPETELKQPETVVTLMVDAKTGHYVGPVPKENDGETAADEEVSNSDADADTDADTDTDTDTDADTDTDTDADTGTAEDIDANNAENADAEDDAEETSDPIASEDESDKPQPIKEYFIVGTEPRGAVPNTERAPVSGESGDTPLPPAQDGAPLEGLF